MKPASPRTALPSPDSLPAVIASLPPLPPQDPNAAAPLLSFAEVITPPFEPALSARRALRPISPNTMASLASEAGPSTGAGGSAALLMGGAWDDEEESAAPPSGPISVDELTQFAATLFRCTHSLPLKPTSSTLASSASSASLLLRTSQSSALGKTMTSGVLGGMVDASDLPIAERLRFETFVKMFVRNHHGTTTQPVFPFSD
jgi:hypothetical protein